MIFCAPLAAVMVLAAPSSHRHHRHRHATAASLRAARRPAPAEATLRRRIGRMLRLAQLEQRERELRDFLIRAHTETPSFIDDDTHALATGLQIGPTIVTRDFIGSPIIRTHIYNGQQHAVFAVLQAHIRANDGSTADAAIAVSLAAGEQRSIELLCPHAVTPAAIAWTATPL